jgi:hypothetical protein
VGSGSASLTNWRDSGMPVLSAQECNKETGMKTTIIESVCDFDGRKAGETNHFTFEGVAYEMELCDQHQRAMDRFRAELTGHARRVPATGHGRARPRRPRASSEHSRAVRAWAIQTGRHLPPRGRIPAAIIAEYNAATAAH